MSLSITAERLLTRIVTAAAADRPAWLVRDDGPGSIPRYAFYNGADGTTWITSVPGPVVDELLEAGRIDIAGTASRIGQRGPAGRRVQPTASAWAARTDQPADVLTARITTWEALP